MKNKHKYRGKKRRRNFWNYFVPRKSGIITGAADNDPSGIVTYTQAGAVSGFSLLWLMVLSLPMLISVEEMSARVGVVAKKGLNKLIAQKFGIKWAGFTALIVLVCNVLTIAADIAGMGEVAATLTGINSIWYVLFFGLIFLYILISKGYRALSRFLLIITPIFLLYVVSAFLVDVPWKEVVISTFVPSLNFLKSSDLILIAVGVMGTTISPYLIFWQTTEEIEERKTVDELDDETAGVVSGMFFCQIIFYFIIVAAAAVFFGQNKLLDSPGEAALALRPLAGDLAFLLFSVGIVGSGFLSVPVLAASTAYVVADTYSWKEGLEKKAWEAQGFYGVILLSIVGGVAIALSGIDAITMLFLTQVLNGMLVPILLVFLILITSDEKIMGKYKNSPTVRWIGWITFSIMVLFDLVLFWDLAKAWF